MLRKLLSLVFLSAAIISVQASAAIPTTGAGPQYKIEIIVFKQPYGTDKSQEQWSASKISSLSANNVYSLKVLNTAVTPNLLTPSAIPSYTLLPQSEFVLTKDEKALQSRGYKILLHVAWQQPLSSSKRSTPVLMIAGKGYDDENQVVAQIPSSTQPNASDDLNGRVTYWELEGTIQTYLDTYYYITPHLHFIDVSSNGKAIYEINQTQRAKSKEIHYFDHPRFGALVEITPVKSEG